MAVAVKTQSFAEAPELPDVVAAVQAAAVVAAPQSVLAPLAVTAQVPVFTSAHEPAVVASKSASPLVRAHLVVSLSVAVAVYTQAFAAPVTLFAVLAVVQSASVVAASQLALVPPLVTAQAPVMRVDMQLSAVSTVHVPATGAQVAVTPTSVQVAGVAP